MKRTSAAARLYVIALCTTLSVLLPQMGCDRSSVPVAQEVVESQPEALLEVTTARVRRGSILQRISAPGSLLPLRESRIGTEIGRAHV